MTQMLFGDFGYIVDSCPRNKTEFTNSATRLNCGVDENGRSQYVCVPNHKKSALVEFCYNLTTTGLYEKGNCLDVYESGNLDLTSCLHFTEGCPSDHFFLSDLHKFPACHGINPQERCFYADPVCPNRTDIPDTGISPENGKLSTGAVAGITLGILGVAMAIVVVILILLKRRHKSSKGLKKPLDEMELKTTLILGDSQSNKRKQENKYNTLVADVHELEKNEEEQGSMSEDSQPEVHKYLDAQKSKDDAESQNLVPKNCQGTGEDLPQKHFHAQKSMDDVESQIVVPKNDAELQSLVPEDDAESQSLVSKINQTTEEGLFRKMLPGDTLFDLGDYSVWETGISDQFSTLPDDDVSVLYCFLCSDSGPPDFTDKEWLDLLNQIREDVYDKKDPVTSEEAQQTLDRLKSRDFPWKDQDKIHINDDVKDETMYPIALKCKSVIPPVPFHLSSYDTATQYLRSSRYTRKNGEKCVILKKYLHICDSFLILRLQMNILTHVTLEDTNIFKMIVILLNTPDNKLKEKQSEREQFIKDLKETGERVHYRGRSQDSVHHVTWLWRYGEYTRPDIVRSCIGLHPHNDIYIINNKAYRKTSKYHKYLDEDRSLLYCLLLCDKYTDKVKEDSFKSILKKIRERYFPKLARYDNADFTRLQRDVKETQNGVMTFASDKIRHDVMYAFVTECLVEDSDLEFFLTTASRDVISEYCRSWDYKRREGERCLYVPYSPREMENLFIDRLQMDIIKHCTISDRRIHKSISERLKIPEEVLKWDIDARKRFVNISSQGTQDMCRARGMLVGCAGAGKTTLLRNLQRTKSDYSQGPTETTVGLEIHEDLFEIKDDTLIDFKWTKEKTENNGTLSADSQGKEILSMTDFAGQVAYYACHQIYLSRRAFYLVVVDMSKGLGEEVHVHDTDRHSPKGSLFHGWTYKDYFLFWLRSIKTYCEDGDAHETKTNPVILIASHHDCIKQKKSEMTSAQIDKNTFYDKLEKCLPMEHTLKDLISPKRYHEIECPQERLNEHQAKMVENVRKCIVQTARGLTHWGEKIPVKWTMFEQFVRENKQLRILSRGELRKKKEFQSLNKREEGDMLRYFKEIGLIIYFAEQGLEKNIIVDVQWFVDAFKNIITDPTHASEFCKSRQEWEEFMNTGRITDSTLVKIWGENSSYVAQKDIIMPYMEKLGILAEVRPREATGKEMGPALGARKMDAVYYIPSISKTDFTSERREIMNNVNKTPVLVFSFKTYIPHFFFFRLVAICLTKWESLGIHLFCKNVAFYTDKGGDRNIAIAVNTTSIQLQVFTPDKAIQLKSDKVREIRYHVEEMMKDITTTFHHRVLYQTGYTCKDIQITEEDDDYFLSERRVAELETSKRICPNCLTNRQHERHDIVRDDLLHYWYKVNDVSSSQDP